MIYEVGSGFLILNPDSDGTHYAVQMDDNSDARHVVTATTFEGGPMAQFHIRPYQKMEYWSGGQLIQTDGCYATQ